MKRLSSPTGLFILAFLILLTTNIFVLSGVALNRSGTPMSQVTLTDRELQLAYNFNKENTGLQLTLDWRGLGENAHPLYIGRYRNPPDWMDAEKLTELGFHIDARNISDTDFYISYKKHLPREVFIVLELDGESYKTALTRAETAFIEAEQKEKEKPVETTESGNTPNDFNNQFLVAKSRLEAERNTNSRLFAVDAGLGLDELKEKYRDRTRYIIAKGLVNCRMISKDGVRTLIGNIQQLSIPDIYVPLKHRSVLDRFRLNDKRLRDSAYQIELVYGNRAEPWIVSVKTRDVVETGSNLPSK